MDMQKFFGCGSGIE